MNKLQIFIIIFAINILKIGNAGKCLNESVVNKINPKYTHYESKTINLTLATTHRISHQLTTLAFQIILEELLGYQHVQIVYIEDKFSFNYVVQKTKAASPGNPPNWMINLGVWIPPNGETVSKLRMKHLKDFGNIGQPGRFGWFIPKNNINKNVDESTLGEIHWALFRNEKEVIKYDIADENILRFLKHNSQNVSNLSCGTQKCVNDMFTPKQCINNISCALLLAPKYEDTSFIIEHIDILNLYVKVMWFDDKLYSVIQQLTNEFKYINNLLILYYIPSELIHPQHKFINVILPTCNTLNGYKNQYIYNSNCYKYELHRIAKLGWANLQKSAPSVDLNLPRFTIPLDDLQNLFEQYQFNHNLSQIACNYISNVYIEDEHSINQLTTKDTLYIGGIFPFSGNSTSLTKTAYGIRLAAQMAIDAINNLDIVKGYKLQLISHNGQCESNHVLKAFIEIIQYVNLLGILGPACSETVEPLAGISNIYNTLTISYSAEGVSFKDRQKYALFFRTIGENQHYINVYTELFKYMKWKRIISLTEDGHKYTEYLSLLTSLTENKKFPRMINDINFEKLRKTLFDIQSKNYYIIILDVNEILARAIMCEAYHLNMTSSNSYVWFLPNWYSNDWYNTTLYNTTSNCTDVQMLYTINGYFTLEHAFFDSEDVKPNIFTNKTTINDWIEFYHNQCVNDNITHSHYAGYAYDAVWTYALAVKQLLSDTPDAIGTLHSDQTTNKLINYIKNIDFNGISGRIKFDSGGSRYSIIKIIQWFDKREYEIGEFIPDYTDIKEYNGVLHINKSQIKWLNLAKQIPDDGTRFEKDRNKEICIVENFARYLNVACNTALVIINILGFSTLTIFLGVIIYIFKRKYEHKVLQHKKLLSLKYGLAAVDLVQLNTLDKWEMCRENVVINRQLGHGAFGTVYGGEAFFQDKGWMPVAVKTLKIGSTTEEKLDFLSEAKVMKDLEHKNIVKLLGVCTQSEPVYTIMEFMLYGDLKTYLLGRRHLVKQQNSMVPTYDNNEISNKKLTLMALDIACALSYLADIKYVHRDVACRNCLLNSHRMVKLGDFGMTRPMYENDYYKFNRRGMLPVRWMAPESLGLGIFTSASDVWSYGVLLYEIITFGSFPFQGKTNTEVLEYVKNGNTLNVPKGVKPQLEALMKSCWNIDPKRRPQASQIVDFLANSPRLLSPCLDVPLSSVDITYNYNSTNIDPNNLPSLPLPETFRKCSVDGFLIPPAIPPPPQQQTSLSSLSSSSSSSTFSNITKSNIHRLRPSQKLIINNELRIRQQQQQQYSPSTISTSLFDINSDNDDEDDGNSDDNGDQQQNDNHYHDNNNTNIESTLLLNLLSSNSINNDLSENDNYKNSIL